MKSISFVLLASVFWISTSFNGVNGQVGEQAGGQVVSNPSVLTGVYTEEQAIHGQTLYYQYCLACHGEMMNGLDQAPPLAGPQFSSVWQGESLWSLLTRIGTMPPDQPDKLSTSENVAILAYMLWFNGFPLSDVQLSIERDVLNEITFQATPPGQ